jgi:hypothetical protein
MANEKNVLKAEKLALQSQLEEKMKPLIDVNIEDPSPKDTAIRKIYVSRVAGFFKEILNEKLNQMISVAHNILEETNSSRDYDLILKGIVFSYRDLIRWGESMVNEQMANQTTEISEEDKKTLEDNLNKKD